VKQSHFSASFFSANRAKLRSLVKEQSLIAIAANGLLQRNSDISYPFRQDSNFWYLTGIEEPDVVLVIDGNDEYLIVEDRDERRAAFDGSIDIEAMKKVSGIASVYGRTEGWNKAGEKIAKNTQVATLAANPAYDDSHGIYANPARARLRSTLAVHNPDIKLVDIRLMLARMRMVKEPSEIEAMKKALAVTRQAFQRVAEQIETFEYEYEIERELTSTFVEHSATHAYQPIVAAGKNACTLHYTHNNGPINKRSLLLIDAGAEYSNYASDITRTFAVGKISDRMKQVFVSVQTVQDYAMELLKPGVLMREYEENVEQFMGKELQKLGLISTNNTSTVRKYYPHATSHFLGLDTHDVADYTLPLSAGMVLTVEPGIYIPEENIGVRIEDNVILTDKGIVNLSEDLPKTPMLTYNKK
jgi:Xaa-Pro aminopeptidase